MLLQEKKAGKKKLDFVRTLHRFLSCHLPVTLQMHTQSKHSIIYLVILLYTVGFSSYSRNVRGSGYSRGYQWTNILTEFLNFRHRIMTGSFEYDAGVNRDDSRTWSRM